MIEMHTDYYIDGEWGMRSPCPWKTYLTRLGEGYSTDIEAARAREWQEAAHPKNQGEPVVTLTVVKREWARVSDNPFVL